MDLELATPRRIDFDFETLTPSYGKLTAEPFERGYGVTIGNAFRRVLLSSLPGAAVTSIKIAGARHEFSTIAGVVEDVTDIVLNIKGLLIKLKVPGPKTVYLRAQGAAHVTAAHITPDPDVEIMNPDIHIATLEEDAAIDMELTVNRGRGYATAEQNASRDDPIGVIAIDSVFTPVLKVNFAVENTRLGPWTEFDRLILELWTNKTVRPPEAIAQAAAILRDHFAMFVDAFPRGEADVEVPLGRDRDESPHLEIASKAGVEG